jgi:hypothetical protein
MENAYEPHLWHDAFVMVGGASAALAGLLFVAASLHTSFLMSAPHWRIRVFNNTMVITAMVIEAALVLSPQSRSLLGWELIGFNLFFTFFLPVRFLVHLLRHETEIRIRRAIYSIAALLLGAWGGTSLELQYGGGMYFVLASVLIVIWLVILNAFSLMTVSHQAETAMKSTSVA